MKKTLDVIKNVITWIIVAVAVAMMIFTIVSVNTFNRTDRNLFGYKAFIVLSDSMSATDFAAGDLVLVKNVDPTTLQPGDIISFTSQNSDNFGEIVTHKIREITKTSDGETAFRTYGTTTGVDDETLVTYPYIVGKYQSCIPKLGYFFNFLKTVPGYICCILIPFLLLIIIQLVNFIKTFKAYKAEQLAVIEAERLQVEEDRRKSEAMMQEILELKAQLQAQQNAAASNPAVSSDAVNKSEVSGESLNNNENTNPEEA